MAGAVTVGKDLIYAFYEVSGRTARVRMSADEGDRLDLFPGKQIDVRLNGEAGRALVTSVVPAPPFVWVELAR